MATTVDDGDATGFSVTGPWTTFSGQGFHNQVHFAAAGNGGSIATWAFAVTPGTYKVSATWSPYANRATNAPYTVLDGATPLGTVPVNQQLAPADFTDQGVGWKTLGTFTVAGNTLVVTLSNNANGYVIADAVEIVSAAPPPPPVTFTSADNPPEVAKMVQQPDGSWKIVSVSP